jgi:hypothetical protein
MRIAFVLLLAACGSSPPPHPDNEAATLGGWCDEIGAAMCVAMADACFSGNSSVANGCKETFGPNCVGGRAAEQPSGRTWGEAKICIAKLKSLSCEGLGAGIGSGSLAQYCQVKITP